MALNSRRMAVAFWLLVVTGGVAAQDATIYDVVKLKNGQELVGRVTAEDDRNVSILFRGGEMVLPRRRIKEIIRAERATVEEKAVAERNLARYETRDEHFFLYYRGRRVGWREVSVRPSSRDGKMGYLFEGRSVFVAEDGKLDLDVRVVEFIDQELRPISYTVSQISPEYTTLTDGKVEKGHLGIKTNGAGGYGEREVIFDGDTNLFMPLMRMLADATHYPEKGDTYKVLDTVESRFARMSATRTLRKEVVGGKHQFVTVWQLESGERSWEIWIDGYGGIVREELGGPHMVALRSPTESVLAYARGERNVEEDADLSLAYESVPDRFRLVRPNLTWSFDFPDVESAHALTLENPTLQASVDVVVMDGIEPQTEPETIVLDLIERMERGTKRQEILFQKPERVGGLAGLRFEATSERKGVSLRTVGAVAVSGPRAYALLLAAPSWRYKEASSQLERILESFEVVEEETADNDG